MHKKLLLTVIGLGFSTFLLFTLVGMSKRMNSGVNSISQSNPLSSVSQNMFGNETTLLETEPNIGRKMIVPPPPSTGGDALDEINRVTRKYSNTSVITDNIQTYLAGVSAYMESIGGRVMSSSIYKTQQYDYGYLSIRVPSERFVEATAKVTENVDSVHSQQMSNEDETGTYTAQLDARTKVENQLKDVQNALLNAKTDAEKKQLEREIADLKERIAYYDQLIRSVKEQHDFATITVTAASSERYFSGVTPAPENMKEVFLLACRVLKAVLIVLLQAAIWVAVFSVLWLPVVLVIRFFKRKKQAAPMVPFTMVPSVAEKPVSLAKPKKPRKQTQDRVRNTKKQ